MSGLCGTCKHWQENTGWDDAVDSAVYPEPVAVEQAREKHNCEMGICGAVIEGWQWDGEAPLPLATVRDGSEYKATLHTHETFGCVLWER